MDTETVEAAGFGVGVKRNLVGVVKPKFPDQHGDRARVGFLQRNSHFEFIRLWTLPLGVKQSSLLIFELHIANAACGGRLQMESVFSADDQRAGIFRSDDPLRGPGSTQAVVGSVEGVKAPGCM